MDYFPLFYDIRGQQCLLVGGGSVAVRKARLLLKAGAQLVVVSLAVNDELRALVEAEPGSSIALREFAHTDLDDCRLVIAATDDRPLNQQISEAARQRQIPVNVVDDPELCSFITPAIIERGDLTLAVSSAGKAPVLARLVRTKIEQLIPPAYGRLAGLANQFRDRVKTLFSDTEQRRYFWDDTLQGPIANLVLNGQQQQAEQQLSAQLDSIEAEGSADKVGEVYLVGGGPGDPELLTIKALRLMQQADVVLYDRLISDEVMELVRRDADRIYVGKRRSDHAVPQQDINQLLVDLAKQGKRVLRLKGGDPFIFGRGGEEIELLAANQVAFQVVPGITAASGCSAYAGIPLTHRDYAQSVRFITGHLKDDTINLNWKELGVANQTLVFYMGLKGLPVICRTLIENGRAATTPAALVEKGTTRQQRVIIGTLENLAQQIAEQDIHAPTLLIIGETVQLHDQLAWFQGDER